MRMDTHRELAALTAERKIPAVVQKPFAPEWDECIAIVEKSRSHGAWLAVHKNFRFASVMMRVSQVIAAGTIGTPSWGRICFRTGYDAYKSQSNFYNEERLAILDVGIHVLDLARVFMGGGGAYLLRDAAPQPEGSRRGHGHDDASPISRSLAGAGSIYPPCSMTSLASSSLESYAQR
jgi:predicted dehydrogenase